MLSKIVDVLHQGVPAIAASAGVFLRNRAGGQPVTVTVTKAAANIDVRAVPACPSPADRPGVRCLGERILDLDGDRRPDKLGLYAFGYDPTAFESTPVSGRAVLANGRIVDNELGPMNHAALDFSGDMNGDGSDEAVVTVGQFNTGVYLSILTLQAGRLALMQPSGFPVSYSAHHGEGFSCVADAAGRPALKVTRVQLRCGRPTRPRRRSTGRT